MATDVLNFKYTATGQPLSVQIPPGHTNVTVTNKNTSAAYFELGVGSLDHNGVMDFDLTVGSATSVAAGASATATIGSNNFLSVQDSAGGAVNLDVVFV